MYTPFPHYENAKTAPNPLPFPKRVRFFPGYPYSIFLSKTRFIPFKFFIKTIKLEEIAR
jgi:hypothetical protein